MFVSSLLFLPFFILIFIIFLFVCLFGDQGPIDLYFCAADLLRVN